MEEVIINIDSRYRNIFIYPNECKFRYDLEKTYKNIISARMISLEVNNSASYIDNVKKNNFIIVHLPNKLNDPEGTVIELSEGLFQIVGVIQNIFNGMFQTFFNTNEGLQTTTIDNKPYAEKYFYFFYLNDNVEIKFDFNDETNVNNLPVSILNKFTLTKGWHSIYGMVLQIQDYIKIKYNERKTYKNLNPSAIAIPLDAGNFLMKNNSYDVEDANYDVLTLPIFDRRFRSDVAGEPTEHDCIRYDNINDTDFLANDLTTNLTAFKYYIYSTYITDTSLFIPQTTTTYSSYANHGILDRLNAGEFIIPNNPIYTSSGNKNPSYGLKTTKLTSNSIYYLNIAYLQDPPAEPTSTSTQIYNLLMQVDLTALKVSFSNFFTRTVSTTNLTSNFNFYYYYVPPTSTLGSQTWNFVNSQLETINSFDSLFNNKKFLLEQKFITQAQYNNPFFQYTAEKDIADFEIDFSTYKLSNPITNGLLDINKMSYPPVGYYLGFRPDYRKSVDNFNYKGKIDNTERVLTATKIFDTTGDDYIFLKINDWGYIDFFNQRMFAKILLTSGLGNPKIDDYINKEYRFRQPLNIQKLDIELTDYLGNTVDLAGFDWSFTLELKQVLVPTEKVSLEKSNLIFSNVYRN
jgi:hypothetical protein